MDFFEDKFKKLEVDSFDLKMQQYYSKMKSSSKDSSADDPEILTSLIEDHCIDTLALREANDTARRKISYLESELVQLRAQKSAESNTFGQQKGENSTSNSDFTPLSDFSHLCENRRHERQANIAIAEHDAILIHRLQKELATSVSLYDAESRLVKDRSDRVTSLLKENEDKGMKISELEIDYKKANAHIKSLETHIKANQLIFESERKQSRTEAEALPISREGYLHPSKRFGGGGKSEYLNLSPANMASQIHLNSRRDVQTENRVSFSDYLSPSSGSTLYDNVEHLRSLDERPKTMMQQISSRASPGGETNKGKEPIASLNTDCRNPLIRAIHNNDGPSANANNGEWKLSGYERDLRIEITTLSKLLERERSLLREQDIILRQVRDSAVEITLLEAEEIARLECDLDKCHDEKENWRRKCRRAEYHVDQLSQQLKQLELLVNHGGISYRNVVSAITDSDHTERNCHVAVGVGEATVCVDIGGGICAYQPVNMFR
jgi:hypothetical protein